MLNLYNGAQKKDEMEMRKVYSSKLAELMEKHIEIIALEADLMNAITTNKVQDKYPERVINCGIMEANMVVLLLECLSPGNIRLHTLLQHLQVEDVLISCLCQEHIKKTILK